MANSNCNAVDSVRSHIVEKMLYAVLQDIKVCTGFYDKETLTNKISEYIDDCYKPTSID